MKIDKWLILLFIGVECYWLLGVCEDLKSFQYRFESGQGHQLLLEFTI